MNNPMMTPNLNRAEAQAFARRADGPTHQLPLRRGYFGRMRISRRELETYEATARSLLDAALARPREDDRTWKQLGSHAGFRRSTKLGDNGQDQQYRLQGTVRASLNNLMGIMYADSTAQVVERRQTLYKDCLDAQTLCVLKERSAENMQEHLSLRWQAMNLSNNSPIYRRDACFLEFTGVTTDVDGFPVGFKVAHSVERNECGSLKDSHGISRLVGTEITLLRPTHNASHTEISLDGVVREPENLPAWLVSSFLGNLASCVSKLALVVQEKTLAKLPLINEWQLVPYSERKTCNVCLAKFGMLSKKNHCRSCGEVICKSCVVTRTVGETAKFCKKCIIVASTQSEVVVTSSEYGSGNSFIRASSSSGASRDRRDSEISTSTTSSTVRSAKLPGPNFMAPKMHVDMKLLDGLNKPGMSGSANRNECSISSTASEGSFDSSGANSYCFDRRSSDAPLYGSLDEDGIVNLDTRQMVRSARGPDTGRMFPSSALGNSTPRGVPSVEAVEDSIAHQRHLLQEMMTQAKTYQQQQQLQQQMR